MVWPAPGPLAVASRLQGPKPLVNEKHQHSSIGYRLPVQFDNADHAAHKTVAAASKASYEQLFQGFSILSAWLDLSPERNHMRAGIHLFPRTEDTKATQVKEYRKAFARTLHMETTMIDEPIQDLTAGRRYLSGAVQHQLVLLSPDDINWTEQGDDCVLRAFESVLRSLRGAPDDPVLLHGTFDGDLGLNVFENTDHYAVFLAYLGCFLASCGEKRISWRVFALNKMLHGLNISPNVRLPNRFRISHGVGTVIGQASLGNRLLVSQGCTIGASTLREYPTLDSGVSMMANSAILGRCRVGSNVMIGAGVHIINVEVPSDTLVVLEGNAIKFVPSEYPKRFSAQVFG